jgi:hypothetical protein
MRPIGFSTGALAFSNFRQGLRLVMERNLRVVELSALRYAELAPLVEALPSLDLSRFRYVSVHAPSKFDRGQEGEVIRLLHQVAANRLPIVLHPDTICDFSRWKQFGSLLLIENMDKRCLTGRTVDELEVAFSRLPEAGLCLDVGHSRQVDPTMNESLSILKQFGSRLRQLHVSEVNSQSQHDPLSDASIGAFRRIANLIPQGVPIVLESRVQVHEITLEVQKAHRALQVRETSVGRSVAYAH